MAHASCPRLALHPLPVHLMDNQSVLAEKDSDARPSVMQLTYYHAAALIPCKVIRVQIKPEIDLRRSACGH